MRWNPERYQKTGQHRVNLFNDLLRWANIDHLENQCILDVGCGNGTIDFYMAEHFNGCNIVAIDSDEHMIQYANQHNQHPSIQYKKMNAAAMTLTGQFDIVLSLACLHWIKDQQVVLTYLHSLIKPGGLALLLICPKPTLLWQTLDEVVSRPYWQPYFNSFDPGYYFYNEKNYPPLAEVAGFKIKKIECVFEKLKDIDSQAAFESLISGWLPHLKQLPNVLHPKFLREISECFIKLMQQQGINNFADHERSLLKVYLQKPHSNI
ncbi:MAG: hypothetical protein A3E87_10645 [Gammaproteobacteria bacterium RIFCSPHIGHO2_12_FULL_35_23]|nr:MAG: hypothetical protein A3E87_10645 [Gammaproteobacteria bacterium RIFCSPHIGHO2_12_FULL_35_23]